MGSGCQFESDRTHLNNLIITHMNIEQIARTCHEVNKTYCESLGDYSQTDWDRCPEWQRDSTINGIRFYLENPSASPEDLHNNWMKEKLEQGWKYGAIKDSASKLHPCLVTYEDLPKEQQVKDKLFTTVIKSFLK